MCHQFNNVSDNDSTRNPTNKFQRQVKRSAANRAVMAHKLDTEDDQHS